jgi:hypothetical protein
MNTTLTTNIHTTNADIESECWNFSNGERFLIPAGTHIKEIRPYDAIQSSGIVCNADGKSQPLHQNGKDGYKFILKNSVWNKILSTNLPDRQPDLVGAILDAENPPKERYIDIEDAHQLLEESDAINLLDENETLTRAQVTELTGEGNNQFLYLTWVNEHLAEMYQEFFEKDNAEPKIEDGVLILINSDGEPVRIKILKTVKL